MSIWDQAASALNVGLDAVYGETTDILRPVASAGAQYVLSATPPPVLHAGLVGVIDETGELLTLDGDASSARNFRGHLNAGGLFVSYARARFASSDDWPKQGDIIHALASKRASSPWFEVVTADPDEGDRITCAVVRRKAP